MNPGKPGKLLCKKGNSRLECYRKYTPGCCFICLPFCLQRLAIPASKSFQAFGTVLAGRYNSLGNIG